ncbi:MAG: response regulator [Anaerolineales bacterium]|jgi:DNA-binding response OmpR family regulator
MNDSAKILIVDDQVDTLALLELTLQTAGYAVQTSTNAENALQVLHQETFDVVLLDVMMPGMNGFEMARTLSAQKVDYPPIIFLSARAGVEDRKASDEIGAVAYLTKPATRGQLLDAIKMALDSKEPSGA